MNSFYQLPKWCQYALAIIMMLILGGIMLSWYKLIEIHPAFFLTLFLLSPLYHLLLTPLMTLTKSYVYINPMLLAFNPSEERYDLHMGTSFDYLMVMRGTPPGISARYKNLGFLLDGLLKIIDRIETGALPDTVEVRGSSYFFSDRTAESMGFKLSPTGLAEKCNIVFNYLELLWTYSYTQGRLSFPNLNNIKTASTSGAELVRQKERIERLYAHISKYLD